MTQRTIVKWWSHYNKCTLLVWGKNTNLDVLSVTIYLLGNKVHSSEHTKHIFPGPLHNSSHCWPLNQMLTKHFLSSLSSMLGYHFIGIVPKHPYPPSLFLLYFLSTYHSLTLYDVFIWLPFAFPLNRNKKCKRTGAFSSSSSISST